MDAGFLKDHHQHTDQEVHADQPDQGHQEKPPSTEAVSVVCERPIMGGGHHHFATQNAAQAIDHQLDRHCLWKSRIVMGRWSKQYP